MRVLAILDTHNEERFVASCLENLIRQGVDIYLRDIGSTDQTVTIARNFLGKGVIQIETLQYSGIMILRESLEAKERLAATLDSDWFIHVDADEIHLPPQSDMTLAGALAEVDRQGYNAINFLEFTFIPTLESPDHDHSQFQKTMRWYYPFLPFFPHRLNAWKKQPGKVELAWSGGHKVRFPGLKMYPRSFLMRHYFFLSVPHAISKFVNRRYDPQELEAGWHGWRSKLKPDMVKLPRQSELRTYLSDDQLDPSNPRTQHYLEGLLEARETSE